MNCTLYRVYDWFKTTRIAARAFYYGRQYRHYREISVAGTVADCEHTQGGDGDRCFDLAAPASLIFCNPTGRWHCEVTPCSPRAARRLALQVRTGERVKVTGTWTFDPDHHIPILDRIFKFLRWTGGGNEIHPVRAIIVLAALFALAPIGRAQSIAANTVRAKSFEVLPSVPAQVSGGRVQISAPGTSNYYYWIVTDLGGAHSQPFGPLAAPGVQAPSSSFPIHVTWTPIAGATYDVLRTATPGAPTGACDCALGTGLTGPAIVDEGQSLAAYTVSDDWEPRGMGPASRSDAIQYVSANGSDSNDGLSWGTAKKTIEAAQTAVEAAASVGTIYLSPSFSETITSPLTIGSSTKYVHVVGSGNATLNCNVDSPSAVCITITSGSSLSCPDWSAATRATSCNIGTGTNMNVTDVVGLGIGDAGNTRFSGWTVEDLNGGSYSGYLVHWETWNQPAVMRDFWIQDSNGKGLGLVGSGTGLRVENGEVNSGNTTGGIPCTIDATGGAIDSVYLHDVSCEHAPPGSPEVDIDPTGGTNLFFVYWEGGRFENSTSDTSSATDIVDIHGGKTVVLNSLDTMKEGTPTTLYPYQIESGFSGTVLILNAMEGTSFDVINNLAGGITPSNQHDIPVYTYSDTAAVYRPVFDTNGLYLGNGAGYETELVPSSTNSIVTLPAYNGTLAIQLSGQLTTTAATSDNLTISGVTTSSKCVLSAANSSAATNIATTYVSAVSANTVTITHTATSGMVYNVSCSVN